MVRVDTGINIILLVAFITLNLSFQSTILLPITLLAILVASSASPVPTDTPEDYSDPSFLSHPNEKTDIILKSEEGEGQWNGIIEANEPRHLERRSPICKRSASPCIIKKSKKLLLKAKKLKPIWKPKAKKLAKKLAIVGIPTAALAGGTGLGGFALSQAFGGGGQGGLQIPQIPNFG